MQLGRQTVESHSSGRSLCEKNDLGIVGVLLREAGVDHVNDVIDRDRCLGDVSPTGETLT